MKSILPYILLTVPILLSTSAEATQTHSLHSPAKGIVCDQYFCANADGVSVALTEHYLSKKEGHNLVAQGDFDHSRFTFANGIHCDIKERTCYKDRYFGRDGKPSDDIDTVTTQTLFQN